MKNVLPVKGEKRRGEGGREEELITYTTKGYKSEFTYTTTSKSRITHDYFSSRHWNNIIAREIKFTSILYWSVFFFLLLQTDYLPEKLGIPIAQIEKSPLPVDVHQIKTSLLKLTNDFLRSS